MNTGYMLLIALAFSFLLIVSQRIINRSKRAFRIFILMLAILLLLRGNLLTENLLAYLFALVTSFLFWLLIGRYNPVGKDDNIKVYGMDD